VRNRGRKFVCEVVTVRVETSETPFTYGCRRGQLLDIPIKHGEGCYVADEATIAALEANGQVVFRYADRAGRSVPEANPNGSLANIAGVCNQGRNVVGLMPHPEHAVDRLAGGEDGLMLFRSVQAWLGMRQAGARREPTVVPGP
jgi:phosphoribosylformylglycinamidine synthase subunit PurQ / glutaminase